MPFLTLFDVYIRFAEKELVWRSYTDAKALSTTKRAELIDRRELAAAVLDKNEENFVLHMATLLGSDVGPEMTIYSSQTAPVASFFTNKAPVAAPIEYSDYVDVFSSESTAELSNITRAVADHSQRTRACGGIERRLLTALSHSARDGKAPLPLIDDFQRQ